MRVDLGREVADLAIHFFERSAHDLCSRSRAYVDTTAVYRQRICVKHVVFLFADSEYALNMSYDKL